jgi:hypothetical protein
MLPWRLTSPIPGPPFVHPCGVHQLHPASSPALQALPPSWESHTNPGSQMSPARLSPPRRKDKPVIGQSGLVMRGHTPRAVAHRGWGPVGFKFKRHFNKVFGSLQAE